MVVGQAVLTGCGDSSDDGVTCLPMLPRDCASEPEPPIFREIYPDLLRSCGAPGTGAECHGTENDNGLDLSNIDTAYDELLGHAEDGRARVIEEDPECSVLVQRLESDDRDFRMPRSGNQFNERQLCAVRRWIANGAKRDED